jgi:hypothetical protein
LLASVLAPCALLVTAASDPGRAAAHPPSGTIQVRPSGPVRTVTPTLIGLNGVNLHGPLWNDGSLDAVLKRFGPGVLRYPGGTAANYWSWQSGWYQAGRWPGEPGKPVDDRLQVFDTAVKIAGAVPMFVLNTVTYNGKVGSAAENTAMLDQQLQFLRAASAQGLPVRFVELGNELYLNGYSSSGGSHARDYVTRFPTAVDYATQMNAWITAIHREFPGVRIAAVAADSNDVQGISERRRTWNGDVLPVLKGEDAVILHENQQVFDASSPPASVLSMPYLHLRKLEANELSLFAKYHLPVWLTAFNMVDHTADHGFQGTWLHGLFVAEQALLFLGVPTIANVDLDASVGTVEEGSAIFDGPHAFGTGGPPTVPLALSAAGTTLSMIQGAFAGASTAQALSFSPAPRLASTAAPALIGEVLASRAGRKVILVNLSSQAVSLDLSAIFPSRRTVTELTAPSITTLVTGPQSTRKSSSVATGPVEVGPYALTEVSG